MKVFILSIADEQGIRLTHFHGLITAQECAALIDLARPAEQDALVSPDGVLVKEDSRRNTMSWIDQRHPLVDSLNKRIAAITGIPLENQEPLQVLHYLPGQEYKPHYDAFPDGHKDLARGGNRQATVILYLNEVEDGGSTSFQNLDAKIMPHIGSGAFFRSLGKDGKILRNSLHSGDPVIKGEKWIATKWIRQGTY